MRPLLVVLLLLSACSTPCYEEVISIDDGGACHEDATLSEPHWAPPGISQPTAEDVSLGVVYCVCPKDDDAEQ